MLPSIRCTVIVCFFFKLLMSSSLPDKNRETSPGPDAFHKTKHIQHLQFPFLFSGWRAWMAQTSHGNWRDRWGSHLEISKNSPIFWNKKYQSMMIIVILQKSFSSFVTLVHCKVSFVTFLPTELARQKHLLAIYIYKRTYDPRKSPLPWLGINIY